MINLVILNFFERRKNLKNIYCWELFFPLFDSAAT